MNKNTTSPLPDEQQTLIVSSHLLIRDAVTKKTILNKRAS
jgi:putative hemolysin